MGLITLSLSMLLCGDRKDAEEHMDKGKGKEKAKANVAEPVLRPQIKHGAATPKDKETITVASPARKPQRRCKYLPFGHKKAAVAPRSARQDKDKYTMFRWERFSVPYQGKDKYIMPPRERFSVPNTPGSAHQGKAKDPTFRHVRLSVSPGAARHQGKNKHTSFGHDKPMVMPG